MALKVCLAERVGVGLRPPAENKELTGFPLPPDPLEPLKGPGRRTYCARGAIYVSYRAHWVRRFDHAPHCQGLHDQSQPGRPAPYNNSALVTTDMQTSSTDTDLEPLQHERVAVKIYGRPPSRARRTRSRGRPSARSAACRADRCSAQAPAESGSRFHQPACDMSWRVRRRAQRSRRVARKTRLGYKSMAAKVGHVPPRTFRLKANAANCPARMSQAQCLSSAGPAGRWRRRFVAMSKACSGRRMAWRESCSARSHR